MKSCVERLARRAYEKGINILVDEDLTEFFIGRFQNSNFKINHYPTYNPREQIPHLFKSFIKDRKGKPWLWQDY